MPRTNTDSMDGMDGMGNPEPTHKSCRICGHMVIGQSRCPRCQTRLEVYRPFWRSAWTLVGVLVFLLLLLAMWSQRLDQDSAPSPDGIRDNQPIPDGALYPTAAMLVPYPGERCIPWHVSGLVKTSKPSARFLMLSSAITDPYGLVLSGFSEECGSELSTLLVENASKEQIQQVIKAKDPDAIVAVGLSAMRRADELAPDRPVFFARITNPHGQGLARPGRIGVSPWIPSVPLLRHLLMVLPAKARIALLVPQGPLDPLGQELLAALKTQGRQANLLPLPQIHVLASWLAEATQKGDAWILVLDGDLVDEETYTRIQSFADERKIPLAVTDEEHVKRGALVGVGSDSHRVGAQLCRLAAAHSLGQIPPGQEVFCPEYSFAVIGMEAVDKLKMIPAPGEWTQAKLIKWH